VTYTNHTPRSPEIRDGTFIPEASGKLALVDWVLH